MPSKRFLRPLVYTTIAGGSAYGTYRYFYPPRSTNGEFTVRIPGRSSDGKRVSIPMTFPLLSSTDVDTKLRENQKSHQFKPLVSPESAKSRAGQVVWHFEFAQVAANEVLEDMEPQARSYPYADAEKGRLLYFTVADGHSGPWTSRFLKDHFINTVAAFMTSNYKRDLESFWKYLSHSQPEVFCLEGESLPASFQLTPETAKKSLQEAFVILDDGICQMPFAAEKIMLAVNAKQDKPQDGQFPTILNKFRRQYVLPAYSGACGLMTLIDTATQELYVACTGDCRAVAGYWDDNAGAWVADPLSEDQTGDVEKEVQRLKLEHPGEESTVVHRGRILGNLQPTRAFGDIKYKWPANALQNFLPSIMPDGIKARAMASNYLTPPYVTARPEVEYRKFSLPPPKKQGSSSGPTLRFVIMATDGFWDEITNAEAVVLAGTYLSGLRTKAIARNALPQTIPEPPTSTDLKPTSPSGPGSSYLVYETTPQTEIQRRPIAQALESRKQGHWAFIDDNIGAHLIRNAFGGGDQLALRQTLSIPAPHARRFRDDITVSVIWWEETDEAPVTAKAKL